MLWLVSLNRTFCPWCEVMTDRRLQCRRHRRRPRLLPRATNAAPVRSRCFSRGHLYISCCRGCRNNCRLTQCGNPSFLLAFVFNHLWNYKNQKPVLIWEKQNFHAGVDFGFSKCSRRGFEKRKIHAGVDLVRWSPGIGLLSDWTLFFKSMSIKNGQCKSHVYQYGLE